MVTNWLLCGHSQATPADPKSWARKCPERKVGSFQSKCADCDPNSGQGEPTSRSSPNVCDVDRQTDRLSGGELICRRWRNEDLVQIDTGVAGCAKPPVGIRSVRGVEPAIAVKRDSKREIRCHQM